MKRICVLVFLAIAGSFAATVGELPPAEQAALDRISAPTLLLAGAEDPLALRPRVLVEAIPDASLELLTGNHISALGDPRFAEAIVEFLAD